MAFFLYDGAARRIPRSALGGRRRLPFPGRARTRLAPAAAFGALVAASGVATAVPAAAQAPSLRDAGLPRPGELWIELLPSVESWAKVFAGGRAGDTVAAGTRVPLHRDFAGPIAPRIFPGLDPLLMDLNAGAADLGFDPVTAEELSLGSLEFGVLQAQRRRVETGFELGILPGLSVEARAPLVQADTEARFRFEGAAATVLPGADALEDPTGLFAALEGARGDLEALVGGGELPPEDEARALELLERSGRFLDALRARVAQNRLIPLAGSAAGGQITSFYGGLGADFTDFGLMLPELGLRDQATAEQVAAFFGLPPLSGTAPGSDRRGWSLPHVEAGVRLGLLNRWSGDRTLGPLRARTAFGARARIPVGDPNAPPFNDPDAFLPTSPGDPYPALELSGYQDLGLGERWLLNLGARYGIRLSDEVTLRVHPPDRPFALAGMRTSLRRDPGDYLAFRAAPQLRLNEAVSIGADYRFQWRGADRFTVLGADPGAVDPTPLALETSGTLHRLGLLAEYRTGRAAPGRLPRPDGEDPTEDEAGAPEAAAPEHGRPAEGNGARAEPSAPWRISFLLQGAVAGSGGRMPAPQLVAVAIRAPLRVF